MNSDTKKVVQYIVSETPFGMPIIPYVYIAHMRQSKCGM